MKKLLRILGAVALGAACTNVVRAGDQTFNMDTDPGSIPGFLICGPNYANYWQPTDGNPATGGWLQIAPAAGSSGLLFVFPDVDLYTNTDGSTTSLPIKAFQIDMDLRVGNGTTQRPADGFSINFARPNDQVLADAVANNGTTTGSGNFAGGDTAPATATPPYSQLTVDGSGDAENGTKTGLVLGFDAWEGNWVPTLGTASTNYNGGSNDREGLRVALDEVSYVQYPFYTNGLPDRNGMYNPGGECTDWNSAQTGPWTGGDGSYAGLCWQHLTAILDTNKQVTVIWKGHTILDHYQLTNFPTTQARLIIAGRTGGNNQNIGVDNIHVVTTPSVQASFAGVAPAGNAGLYGFVATYNGVGPATITKINSASLDGTDVTSSTVLSTVGLVSTATYIQSTRLSAGNHTVIMVATDGLGNVLTNSATLGTPTYFVFPTNNVLPLAAADVTKPGFVVKSYQNPWWQPEPNNSRWLDEQLEGYHGPNYADQSGAVNGEFAWVGPVDFSGTNVDGTASDPGFMTYLSGKGYDNPLATFGIGQGSANTNANFGGPNAATDDNCALEFNAYVYFPTSGVYNAYVGSDDGFRFTLSGNARDRVGTTVMEFSGGRGIGTTTGNASHLAWIINQPGLYPLRLIWENGGGGRAIEWYFDYGNGNYILANDLPTNPNSLTGLTSPVKVYQAVTSGAAPYVKYNVPVMNATGVPLDQEIIVDLGDGSSPVNKSTVVFSLDGIARPGAVVTQASGVTHVVYAPSTLWAWNSVHTIMLTYQDGTATSYTNSWSFTAENNSGFPLTQVPASWAKDPSLINTNLPGFRIRSYQTTAGQANTVQWTDEQLMGQHGPNIANQTGVDANGYFDWPNVIDMQGPNIGGGNSTSGAGFPYNYDMSTNFGFVANNPTTMDNSTLDIGAWVVFPAAGVYTMEVNSDDGFQLSVSPRGDIFDRNGVVLGWYNGGRGSSGTYGGTKCDIYVQAPGAYAFRLLWEDGGGGAGVEWTVGQHLPDGSYQDLLISETHVPADIKAYQSAKADPAHVLGTIPSPDYANRLTLNHSVSRAQAFSILLQSGSASLNTGTIALSDNGVTIPLSVVSAGSNNLWIASYTPDINNPATWWPSGAINNLQLTYSDANGTYTNTFTMATEWYGVLTNALPLASINTNQTGFLVRTYQADQQGGTQIGNRIADGEQVLAGLYGPNVINVYSNLYYGAPVNGYFTVSGNSPTNGIINFDTPGNHDGDFQPGNGYSDLPWPGIPGVGTGAAGGHHTDSYAAEILAYVNFPTNGLYIMGFNSDDGFLITKGFSAPAHNGALVVSSPAAVAGTYLAVPGGYGQARQITTPISGKVVQGLSAGGGTANGNRPGIPAEGCTAFVNASAVSNNIALVYRGTCNFFEKIQAAKQAGATALIIVNNRPNFSAGDGWFPPEIAGDPLVDLPVISIAQTNGDSLVAAMATNDVLVTLNPVDNFSNPTAANSPLGGADYGKGSSDVTFAVQVQQAGVYPLRALYWQGNGGANAEWFSMVGTNKVLLNDNASTNGPALMTYYPTLAVQTRPTLSMSYSAGNLTLTFTGTLQQSTDLKTWTDVTGSSPMTVPVNTGAMLFFRAKH